MAKALQCPQCGYKHRIDTLGPLGATIRCDRCAQVLKVPEQFRSVDALAPRAGTGRPAPPPRPDVDPTVLDLAGRAHESTAAPTGSAVPRAAAPPTAGAAPRRGSRPRTFVDVLAVRILAWVVAVALGGAVAYVIGKRLGYLTKDAGLDIVNGANLVSRYGRLAIVVLMWATVSASLVQLFVEGSRAVGARRQALQRERDTTPRSVMAPVAGRRASAGRR